MFDMDFVSQPANDFGQRSMRGRITLGSFSETFISPLVYWSADDYREQWLRASKHLVEGHDRTIFFTTMYSPSRDNYLFSWPMWRLDDGVYVQNHMVFLWRLRGVLDPLNPYRHIRQFEESSDDGPVSTWLIHVEDIEAYIQRHRR